MNYFQIFMLKYLFSHITLSLGLCEFRIKTNGNNKNHLRSKNNGKNMISCKAAKPQNQKLSDLLAWCEFEVYQPFWGGYTLKYLLYFSPSTLK